MTPNELKSLAMISSIFLILWELMKKQLPGAILGILALFSIGFITTQVGTIFAIFLATPIVIEERWNPKASKDLIRGVLAAGIIAPSIAYILIF